MYLIDREKFGASTEAEAAPFTLPHLISWLRTKPSGEAYSYRDPESCAWTQYTEENGGHVDWTDEDIRYRINQHSMPVNFQRGDWQEIVALGEWPDNDETFGAALARAEKLLALGRAPNSLPYGDL